MLRMAVVVLVALLMSAQARAHLHVSSRVTREEASQLESLQSRHVADFYSGNVEELDSGLDFGGNPRLRNAYVAMRAWKRAIFSDPQNITATWAGADVCNYTGVFCAPALDNPCLDTVAGIDLNYADLAGFLPEQLGYLSDLALFHVSSNRFCGRVPLSFSTLSLLFELDLSNNRLVGAFPSP
eukprot:c11190_g1_i1 orf=2-547(-)